MCGPANLAFSVLSRQSPPDLIHTPIGRASIMASFLTKLAGWMSTSTSILGTAVGIPAVGAALSGTLSWKEAALPIVGSLIALAMPQATPAVTTNGTPTDGTGLPVVVSNVTQLANAASSAVSQLASFANTPATGSVGASAQTTAQTVMADVNQGVKLALPLAAGVIGGPVGALVASTVPEIVNLAEEAYTAAINAIAQYQAASAAAKAAAATLTASTHTSAPAPAAPVPAVPVVVSLPAVPTLPPRPAGPTQDQINAATATLLAASAASTQAQVNAAQLSAQQQTELAAMAAFQAQTGAPAANSPPVTPTPYPVGVVAPVLPAGATPPTNTLTPPAYPTLGTAAFPMPLGTSD